MSGPADHVARAAEFGAWVKRAYRDAYAAGRVFSVYNMEVAFEAGRRHAASPAEASPPPVDNSRCKFASGGARCVSHCGDPVCLGSKS